DPGPCDGGTPMYQTFSHKASDLERGRMMAASGTALMLMIKAQVFRPVRLVSLRALNGRFTGIAPGSHGTALRIGAMTTFCVLERSANVRRCFPVIAETMKTASALSRSTRALRRRFCRLRCRVS